MSEDTPERLKAFRAEYAGETEQGGLNVAKLNLVILVLGFAGVFAVLWLRPSSPGSRYGGENGGLDSETQRELAVYLGTKNQPVAAMAAYQAYLDTTPLDSEARANVCYSIAKLAIEIEDYESALAYLYQAELLSPDSGIRNEINRKILLCLDHLGLSATLKRELQARSVPGRSHADVEEGEVILAEFGDEVITDRELAREIDKLPSRTRAALDSAAKRADFLKNLVAQRLLLDKARRLELHKSDEVQELLARQVDSLIVNKLISDEVKARLHITVEDVERFYRAEIKRYSNPAAAVGTVVSGATEEEALDSAKAAPPGTVQISEGRVLGAKVPTQVQSALARAVLGSKPGPTVKAVEWGDQWYAFAGVLSPEHVQPFEAVEAEARRALEGLKEQEYVAALIEETLAARNVKIYTDRLGE